MLFSKKWSEHLNRWANASASVSGVGRRLLRGSAKPTARCAVLKHRELPSTGKPLRNALAPSAGPSLDDQPQDGSHRHGDRGRAGTSPLDYRAVGVTGTQAVATKTNQFCPRGQNSSPSTGALPLSIRLITSKRNRPSPRAMTTSRPRSYA